MQSDDTRPPEFANLPDPENVLLTVKQVTKEEPSQSEGGIRWAIFNADYNGLADTGALVRLGRRVLIDRALYMAWVRTSPRLSPPKPKRKPTGPPRPAPNVPDNPSRTRRRARAGD